MKYANIYFQVRASYRCTDARNARLGVPQRPRRSRRHNNRTNDGILGRNGLKSEAKRTLPLPNEHPFNNKVERSESPQRNEISERDETDIIINLTSL